MIDKNEKFKIQKFQYYIPYHYCVDIDNFNLKKEYAYGLDYFSYVKPITEYIKEIEFETLLDVGCGDGYLINYLSKFKESSYFKGIDLVGRAINFANLFKTSNNVHFALQDVKEEKDQFDIVTLIHVLEHIPDEMEKDFINEVLYKVKLNGLFIISVPTTNIKIPKKHFRHYTKKRLLELISDSFCLVDVIYSFNNNSILLKLTNKIIINKYFILNNNLLLNKLINFSKKVLFNANENNARYITLILKRIKN